MQVTVAQFRVLAEEAISQRVSLRPAVGLDPEDTTRRSKHKMPVQLRRCMRSEHYPVLLGEMSYAHGLGEAGGAGCVELHVTDTALDNKIANREPGQLALAVSEGDRRRRRQPGEISRLQIPMQRLLEPEDLMRLDGTGEVYAVRQVLGRVHIEHQQRLADGSAHGADPFRFCSSGAGAGLELDRAVAELEKSRQLSAIISIGCVRPIITAGRIGE